MIKIDAHQHFWSYDTDRHSWISDEMNILKRDFLPEDLSEVMGVNGIDGSVAVQADQSEDETLFLLNHADESAFIKGVVGWIDLRSNDITNRLAYFSQFPKLRGFRHVVQDEPDPNFMLKDDFLSGIEKLSDYNYTYDILIFSHQLEAAIKLVNQYPNQKFVIDHIAKPKIRDGEFNQWAEKIEQIAQLHNVWCKVSGVVTEANWGSWKKETFQKYFDHVFKCFGIGKIMFGSDWPVCLLAADYGEVKGVFESYMERFSHEDREKVWNKNVTDFYSLK